MEITQTNGSFLQMLSKLTCQDIEIFIKEMNVSEYESQNITREAYIDSLRSPHCQAKPFPIPQGFKKWIVTTIIILFLIFGLIGNILSATIMFRRSRRGLSSYFYLALLALIDICVLYTGCLFFLFEMTFNYHPQLHSNIACRLIFYFQHLFTYISAWLIVAVTFERLMVVRFPFQSIRLCRMHVAYTITLIIFAFFSIYTAHYFFTLKLYEVHIQTEDGFHPNYLVCDFIHYRHKFAFIDLCFYSVIPSFLILIFNIFIIITMFHAIKKRRDYLQANSCTPTTDISDRNKNKSASTIRTQFLRSRSAESSPAGRSFSQSNKQRICHSPVNNNIFIESNNNNKQKAPSDSTSSTGIRLTCLLLIISFVFVICTLPISVRTLIDDYISEHKSSTRLQVSQLSLTLLMYLNHAVNFALYCLTGRTFRSECRKLICNLWFFKDIHISCTTNIDSNKHQPYQHQQLLLIDRHRYVHPQQQRYHPAIKGVYL